jgi:hypothetical protein
VEKGGGVGRDGWRMKSGRGKIEKENIKSDLWERGGKKMAEEGRIRDGREEKGWWFGTTGKGNSGRKR